MGLLDFLFDKEKQQQRQIEKLKKKLTNMYVQSPERNYAAEQLRDIGTDEALMTMMERFKHNTPNTTYDNEEKLYIYDMLVSLGPTAIPVLKQFVQNENERINWPMKALDDLLSSEEKTRFIGELLAGMEIDYERNPEKKEQLLLRAKEYPDFEDLQKEVARFVSDDNETVRFLAVNAVVEHDTDWSDQALRDNLRFEDSTRVLSIVCQRAVDRGCSVVDDLEDEQLVDDIMERLPPEYLLTEEGTLKRK